jgi:predicted Fe-Mo cluster-binding NifX family protein
MSLNNKTFKICISSIGDTLESDIDPRFGRCEYFIIIDINNKKITNIEAIKNLGVNQGRGAGIGAAEQIGKLGVNLLITGDVGPKAVEILEQLEIKVLKKSGNAKMVLSEYLEEGSSEIETENSHVNFNTEKEEVLKNQRVFIPLMTDNGEDSEISLHFGHAPFFGLYNVDSGELVIKENNLDHSDASKTPVDQVIEQVNPTIVYAQDMGSRAVSLFTEKNIILKTGPYKTAKEVIANIANLDNLTKSCDH